MESKAAYNQLILEIQQSLMSVALKFKADEVEEEILQQLLSVRDSLSTINSQSRPQAKRRGRKKNTTPYDLIITEDKKGETIQGFWGLQQVGNVSRRYADGRIMAASEDEAVKFLMERLFDEEIENPRQYVDEAFKRDEPTKLFRKMLKAAEEKAKAKEKNQGK